MTCKHLTVLFCLFIFRLYFLSQIKLGFVIDLTYTNRFYDKSVVEERHECRYLKLQMRGQRILPHIYTQHAISTTMEMIFTCTDVPRYGTVINIFVSFKLDAGMVKLHRWSRLKHLLISVMDLSDKNLLILQVGEFLLQHTAQ